MGNKVMVNNIPMSLIYAGMSGDRFDKLTDLWVKAANAAEKKIGDDLVEIGQEQWDMLVNVEFAKLCARAAKKAEWNNKPNNTVKKIIRIKKNGKVGK